MDRLYDNMLEEIFNNLSIWEITYRVNLVCKRWCAITKGEFLKKKITNKIKSKWGEVLMGIIEKPEQPPFRILCKALPLRCTRRNFDGILEISQVREELETKKIYWKELRSNPIDSKSIDFSKYLDDFLPFPAEKYLRCNETYKSYDFWKRIIRCCFFQLDITLIQGFYEDRDMYVRYDVEGLFSSIIIPCLDDMMRSNLLPQYNRTITIAERWKKTIENENARYVRLKNKKRIKVGKKT